MKLRLKKDKSEDVWLHIQTDQGVSGAINIGLFNDRQIIDSVIRIALKEQDEQGNQPEITESIAV